MQGKKFDMRTSSNVNVRESFKNVEAGGLIFGFPANRIWDGYSNVKDFPNL